MTFLGHALQSEELRAYGNDLMARAGVDAATRDRVNAAGQVGGTALQLAGARVPLLGQLDRLGRVVSLAEHGEGLAWAVADGDWKSALWNVGGLLLDRGPGRGGPKPGGGCRIERPGPPRMAMAPDSGKVGHAASKGAAAEARGGTYLLRDAETGQVMRTGRTNDLLRREAEHARDPLLKTYDFEPVHRSDAYTQQRGLEQLLHDQYNPPLNRINPINPANPNRPTYLDAAQQYLNQPGGR